MKFLACSMNVLKWQVHPCLCLEQWQTTLPTVGKMSIISYKISCEGFHFSQLFHLLYVSPTGMSTTQEGDLSLL